MHVNRENADLVTLAWELIFEMQFTVASSRAPARFSSTFAMMHCREVLRFCCRFSPLTLRAAVVHLCSKTARNELGQVTTALLLFTQALSYVCRSLDALETGLNGKDNFGCCTTE